MSCPKGFVSSNPPVGSTEYLTSWGGICLIPLVVLMRGETSSRNLYKSSYLIFSTWELSKICRKREGEAAGKKTTPTPLRISAILLELAYSQMKHTSNTVTDLLVNIQRTDRAENVRSSANHQHTPNNVLTPQPKDAKTPAHRWKNDHFKRNCQRFILWHLKAALTFRTSR